MQQHQMFIVEYYPHWTTRLTIKENIDNLVSIMDDTFSVHIIGK